MARTGTLLAAWHEEIRTDGVILGKALGGGLLPVSAFLADRRVMDVFRPGDHGSTFGGNPLAAAVALEALDLVEERNWARICLSVCAPCRYRRCATCAVAGCWLVSNLIQPWPMPTRFA